MTLNPRRLAAVWFADIVGFTRLSASDEQSAVRLVAILQQAARSATAAHGGRVVNFIGDAALAEFNSTDAAMKAAMRIQREFSAAAAEAGIDSCLRIGVHVGDVVQSEDGNLFGDGVNTAARLQEMARPCQIVCSQDVWRHLRPRGEFAFDSLGERQLEGITGKVWVFSVHDPASSPELGSQPLPVWRAALTRLARLGKVLVAYVVASLITWQLVHALTAQLQLPAWVEPLAIALLVVGLLVILVTGWVQARPTWERSVQQKPAWALDLSEAVDELRQQRIPELTWPRAIVGGVMAFGLLFAAALAYVTLSEAGWFLAPRRAVAEPGRAVAILPFETSAGLESWREGVPDLIALTLGKRSDLRVIDPLAVMSRAGDRTGLNTPQSAIELGRSLNARYVLVGSVQGDADSLLVRTSLYDARSGDAIGSVEERAVADSIALLTERLAMRLAAMFGEEGAGRQLGIGSLATRELTALRAFLEGERLFRASRFDVARHAFAEAVSADRDFAFAHYRLSLTSAWAEPPHEPRVDDHAARAARNVEGLPERQALLIRAHAQAAAGRPQAIAVLHELTTKYPNDVEGWFLLGDAYYHRYRATPADSFRAAAIRADSFRIALQHGLALDSTFLPLYLHLMEDAHRRGETEAVRHLLAAVRRVDPGNPLLYGFNLVYSGEAGPATRLRAEGDDAASTSADAGSQRSRVATEPPQRTPAASASASQTRDVPDRSGYEALLRQVNRSRAAALEAGATAGALAAADAVRTRAATAVQQGRVSEAEQLLEQARDGYEDARLAARWIARVDSVREIVAPARDAARGDARTEGAGWETRARQAAAEGRFVEALQAYERALLAYRTPAPAAAGEPAVAREPAARDERPAVEAALQRIARAIEGENIASLLELWPSLDATQQANFRALFAGTRDIRVTFDVRSIDVEGERATAVLQTTYNYFNESERASDSATFPQTLIFTRRDGAWVVTGSR